MDGIGPAQPSAATRMEEMIAVSSRQATDSIRLKSAEARKTAALDLQMRDKQEVRSRMNILRKQMDDTIADSMNVLKKTGEKIRQS